MPIRLYHLGNQIMLLELILVKWMGKIKFCHEHFLLALCPLPNRVLLAYWVPSIFLMFCRSLPSYDAVHIFFLFPHMQGKVNCLISASRRASASVTYHLLRRHLLFFSKETSTTPQSCEGCGIFGVSSSRWCSCPSLVLRHLEGNGSGTKKADCNPFGSWWEASWAAQTSRNWCPSSSSVTCCWMKPCCAHRWQRGRAREVRGARLGWVESALCCAVQGSLWLPCPTPWEFIQTSWAWDPPMSGFTVLITISQKVKLVSLMNADESFEIWFN